MAYKGDICGPKGCNMWFIGKLYAKHQGPNSKDDKAFTPFLDRQAVNVAYRDIVCNQKESSWVQWTIRRIACKKKLYAKQIRT